MIKRNKILHNIKVLSANKQALKSFAKEKYLDDNGVANVNIYINSNNVYNEYSSREKPELSQELIDYIENEVYYIPVEYPINLVIHSNDDIDIEYLSNKIKEHYWKKLADKKTDIRNNKIISIVLLLLGIAFLSLYFYFELKEGTNVVFTEIFSITGSFAIWEAVDYALLNRMALRIEYLNIAQLALLNTTKV